ncbi:MAG: hypothetical protein ACLSHC_11420 [Bilophila wadsworthia]
MEFGKLDASFSFEDLAFAYPAPNVWPSRTFPCSSSPARRSASSGGWGPASPLGKMLIGLPARDGAMKFGGVDIRQLASGPPGQGRFPAAGRGALLRHDPDIALGDPTINDQMILRASTLAGVTEFIRSNPAGFGAQVGEQGMSCPAASARPCPGPRAGAGPDIRSSTSRPATWTMRPSR